MTATLQARTVTGAQLACFDALETVYRRDGRATVRSVAAQLERSPSTTYAHLVALIGLGLVAWWRGHGGTLRPTCEVVVRLET